MTERPEELIAEALRAKARQGGATADFSEESTDRISTLGDNQAATGPFSLSTGWILLLAAVLGLAAGTTIGLLTVV